MEPLYSPITGYDRSAIMRRAMSEAKAARAFSLSRPSNPVRPWSFYVSFALKNEWRQAGFETYAFMRFSDADRATLRSLSTDGALSYRVSA